MLCDLRQVQPSIASIGPRSETADRPTGMLPMGTVITTLQLGRGRKPRIGGNWSTKGDGAAIASIGPRSETADRRWPSLRYWTRKRGFNWAAVGNRGSEALLRGRLHQVRGFNWAAVGNRGSALPPTTRARATRKLQLGRGRKPRIGFGEAGTCRHLSPGFNWAAVGNRGSGSWFAFFPPKTTGFNWAAVGNRGSVTKWQH